MLWTNVCGQCSTLPACVQTPRSTQKPTKNTQYQQYLGGKRSKSYQVTRLLFLAEPQQQTSFPHANPFSQIKLKHHNWSNFKTYLQYQDFWPCYYLFYLFFFLSFICWYDSAGKSESSIFSKGLSPVSVKFVPWTLDVGSEMVQYNCRQFPKERQILG